MAAGQSLMHPSNPLSASNYACVSASGCAVCSSPQKERLWPDTKAAPLSASWTDMYACLIKNWVVSAKKPELTCMPLPAGRCVVFAKEPEEGQDAPEPTEEEAEQGPGPLCSAAATAA